MAITNKSEYPFFDFQPIKWISPGTERKSTGNQIFSIKRDHGVRGTYYLHNPNDEINEHRNYLEKVLIEYNINGNSYDLFTVRDLFEVDYSFEEKAEGNIMGDIAERITRRTVKYFLRHFSKLGRSGGVFDKRFNHAERNNFIVTHSDKYVLKIKKYPNLVILKKTGSGKFGYENIKELDGLFDYRYKNQRHILVLESKLEKIKVNSDDLVTSLFSPLRQLFTNTDFTYVLFSERNSIYRKKDTNRLRQLKQKPLAIYNRLKRDNVGVLFFTFNEKQADFRRMKEHLITQYRSAIRLDVQIFGKMVLSDKKIVLFDGGETPRIKLAKDIRSGLWREVKLYHKNKKHD